MRKIAFCLFLFFAPLWGECPCVVGATDEVMVKGITLVPAGSDFSELERSPGIHVLVRDVYMDGVIRYLRCFLGKPLNGETVKDIKNALVHYFEKEKIFAVAIIPEQEVQNQVIIVEVLLSCIGKVTFDGQKCFPECLLQKKMHVCPGSIFDQEEMLNNLAFLNRNPFHFTTMVLSPGEKMGATDVEFHTDDRFPWRIYAGADNTGVKVDDVYRLFGGLTWGNAFHRNDMMTYQYTCSPNIHQFQSHLLSYLSYLPWRDILLVYGLYGIVNPNITGYTSSGKAAQLSLRYQDLCHPLYERRKSYVEWGFNYKFLNNNLFFEGTTLFPIIVESVNLNELVFGYSYSNFWGRKQVTLDFELDASLWQNLFENQNSASYQQLRPGAQVYFAYLNASAGYHYNWPNKWVFSAYVAGQVATGPLLSSEQFVLGGMDSVRGYLQAQFLADNAFNWNIELYTPPCKIYKYPIVFLGFWDFGYGYNYRAATSQVASQVLSGIGGGLRYHIRSYFSFRVDYAFQLNHIPGGTNLGWANFSIVGSY